MHVQQHRRLPAAAGSCDIAVMAAPAVDMPATCTCDCKITDTRSSRIAIKQVDFDSISTCQVAAAIAQGLSTSVQSIGLCALQCTFIWLYLVVVLRIMSIRRVPHVTPLKGKTESVAECVVGVSGGHAAPACAR